MAVIFFLSIGFVGGLICGMDMRRMLAWINYQISQSRRSDNVVR